MQVTRASSGRCGILLIVAVSVTVLAASSRALAELPAIGTVVNKDNAEKYAEVLNPTQQYMLEHGATMPVTEYRKFEWQPLYKEATEKFSSQVRLSPDGRDIVNYIAGAPFPIIDENDLQAGAKWMWNHEQGPKYTDNVGVGWNVELVNSRGERERFFGSSFYRRMMWRGRLVLDPKPVLPHEPAIGYTEQWGPLHDPADLKGSGALNFRYVSPDVPDDSYLYLPELRKVRRLSMANRSDAFWGTDLDTTRSGRGTRSCPSGPSSTSERASSSRHSTPAATHSAKRGAPRRTACPGSSPSSAASTTSCATP